ncbi:sigma 54-interacting transcriptional regulator, partial [Vibrio cholerae]|uniref:sigma 54-interacting transcriptional regulator n=1 Tax=Vibrio cholerae TaxID=666 RepID=UPI00301B9A92
FLRVLEGQSFERVGGDKEIQVDVRVVTATNRNLEDAVRHGKFRNDLFFRLQVIEIHVPPLREHPEDIPLIARHFVDRFTSKSRSKVK